MQMETGWFSARYIHKNLKAVYIMYNFYIFRNILGIFLGLLKNFFYEYFRNILLMQVELQQDIPKNQKIEFLSSF